MVQRFVGILGDKYPALQNRWYRKYTLYEFISSIGNWMQSVSLPLFTLHWSQDLWLVGLVGALQVLPTTLFGIFAGALTDSIPRKQVVVSSQLGFFALSLILAICAYFNSMHTLLLLGIAFVWGLLNLINQPAHSTLSANMVDKHHIENASALNFVVFNLSRIVGPIIAGFVVVKLGYAFAFLINTMSFLPVIFLFGQISPEIDGHRNTKTSALEILKSTLEGIKEVWRIPELFHSLYTVAIMGVFGFNFSVLIPSLLQDQVKIDSSNYAIAVSCLGLGALVGSLVSAEKEGSRFYIKNMFVFPVLTCLLLVTLGHSKSLIMIGLCMWGIGASNGLFFAKARGILYKITPKDFIGRINSMYVICFVGMSPVGNSIAGFIGKKIGSGPAFTVMGITLLIMHLIGLFWRFNGVGIRKVV